MEVINQPKHLHITEDQVQAFAGRKTLEQISRELLNEIKELDFSNYLGLPKGSSIRQKHLVVAVVNRLLEVATDNRWNMAMVYGSIYLFNGCFWQQIEKDELKSLLGKAASRMGVPEYDAIHFEFKDKLLKQFLTHAHLTPPKNKSSSTHINLLNGTFEITASGNKLRDFEPADFLTNQLPFEYDPAAVCPMFDNFLYRVLPDESCRKVLQEFSGYIFSDLNLEKVLILSGSGSNGKSVFFNILCALIGKDNLLNYSLGMFAHEYNRAKLVNVLLNYSSEKGADLDPDILKLLASREPIQAREPYGSSFTVHIKTKFIINANELFKMVEQSEAFFRRLLVIRFTEKITDSEKDIHLADKIIASELPGIFNWLLKGLDRLMAQQNFTDSTEIENAVQDYKRQSDSVALFVDDKKYSNSTCNKEAIADLYPIYKTFCYDDGYKAVGKNKFSTRLENLGFEKTRLTGGGAAYFMEIDYTFE
jgi:putative DNA primase/helicase